MGPLGSLSPTWFQGRGLQRLCPTLSRRGGGAGAPPGPLWGEGGIPWDKARSPPPPPPQAGSCCPGRGGEGLRGGVASPALIGRAVRPPAPPQQPDHEGPSVAVAVAAARPAAGVHSARGGGERTHLPVAGRGDRGVAGVWPVPAGHLRAAALWPGQPHDVRRVPAAPLHAVLELPGALPVLQRLLRGARGGGAAVRGHPQPRLPLSPRLLRACRLLPGARALPAWRRRGGPRHPQPEHAVPGVPPGHLFRQQLEFGAVPAPPQLHGRGPGRQRAGLLLPRRPVHQLHGLPTRLAGAGGAGDRGVRARCRRLRSFPGFVLQEAPAAAAGPRRPRAAESAAAEGGPRGPAAQAAATAHGAP